MSDSDMVLMRDFGEFGIYLSKTRGQFSIAYEGGGAADWFETFEKALAKADRMGKEKRVKVAVRFASVPQYHGEKWRIRRGTISGFRADGDALLVKWDDGKSEQIGLHYGNLDHLLHDITAEQEAELTQLRAASIKAVRAYEAAQKALQFGDVKDVVQKAQDAKK